MGFRVRSQNQISDLSHCCFYHFLNHYHKNTDETHHHFVLLRGAPMIKKFVILVGLYSATGCVSSGKYDDMEKKYQQTYLKLKKEKNKNEILNGRIKANSDALSQLQGNSELKDQQLAALKRDLDFANQYMEQNKLYAQKISRALAMDGIDVRLEDDRLLVKLPGDVLFASGSARLSRKGKGHIARLGEILSSMDQRKIQIEGHTDDVPIRGGRYDSNWYLGYDRAMSVLKLLVSNGVAQGLISAASYGENKPIASNSTKQGKQQNRRIEVHILPNLAPLQEFINKPKQPELD